jgi:hypothetical protein
VTLEEAIDALRTLASAGVAVRVDGSTDVDPAVFGMRPDPAWEITLSGHEVSVTRVHADLRTGIERALYGYREASR